MELVEGYSLAQILDGIGPQRPLSYVQVLQWADQILSGLSVLHKDSVVHGDIKPQNILIDHRGQAKLVDFGTSYHLEDIWVWTKRAGTEPYWAPEVAFDERRSLISDIYSLGVVLYEMATGQLPYHSPYALLAGQQVRRPREVNPDLPVALESIILHAMARDPNERYTGCGPMLADVQVALTALAGTLEDRHRQRTQPSRIGIRLDSSSPLYYLEQAKQYLANGEIDRALAAAQAAAERSGDHPNYLRLLAGIYVRLDYQSNAIAIYTKLLSVYEKRYLAGDDQLADVLERLGKLYVSAKQYHKAVEVYERLLPLSRNKTYARFRLAITYGLEARYRKAIELLEQVRQARPDAAVVYSKLGWAHMAAGDIRRALSYFNQALVLDPADPFCLYQLARYYLIIGERQATHRYLERLTAVDLFGTYKEQISELLSATS
jgi:tetratricopeptide (TPR) repeat protein